MGIVKKASFKEAFFLKLHEFLAICSRIKKSYFLVKSPRRQPDRVGLFCCKRVADASRSQLQLQLGRASLKRVPMSPSIPKISDLCE